MSDSYQDFLKVALESPDLRLFSDEVAASLNDQQKERQLIIRGEDPSFVRYVEQLAASGRKT